MLVLSSDSRSLATGKIGKPLRSERIIRCVVLRGSTPFVESQRWPEYWQPCFEFARTDTRLIHRLNRLKASWRAVLRRAPSLSARRRYCWRYFGLLHHTLRIAEEDGRLKEALPLLRRVVGFQSFNIELPGRDSCAAAIACHRNPIFLPQYSLSEFFAAMSVLCLNELSRLKGGHWALPFRRFNPASLTTKSGKSVIAQLLRTCYAIAVEDLDLSPEDLLDHMQQFALNNAAVIQFVDEGFATEAFHYVVTKPKVADYLKGRRLW